MNLLKMSVCFHLRRTQSFISILQRSMLYNHFILKKTYSSLMANTKLTLRESNGINWGNWYIKSRSTHWWSNFLGHITRKDPIRFKDLFCVSIPTFHYIFELVRVNLITHPPARLGNLPCRTLEVFCQVALAMRRLANGDCLTTIGVMFGISYSTISKIFSNLLKKSKYLITFMWIVKSYFYKKWSRMTLSSWIQI